MEKKEKLNFAMLHKIKKSPKIKAQNKKRTKDKIPSSLFLKSIYAAYWQTSATVTVN